MEIKKITVAGFKNLGKTTIELDKKITAIVGPNGYGKSNLLQAIEFGSEFIKGNESFKEFLMKHPELTPLNQFLKDSEFIFELELISNINENNYVVNYGYEFEWGSEEKEGRITNEWLKIKLDDKGKRYSSFIKRRYNEAYYKPSPKDRCDKKIKISNKELVVNKLKNYDDIFYFQIINEINQLNIELISKILPEFSFHTFGSKEKMPNFSIETSVLFDIRSTVYELKTKYPDKYEYLINTFKAIFPNIEEIDVSDVKAKNIFKSISSHKDFANKIYIMGVKEKNLINPVEISYLSRGTLRIFSLLTAIILADIKEYSLIGFEELEDSIHPKLLQNLLITLSNMIEKCKIIITSHSPYLVQFLDIDNIYLAIPNEKGIAYFKRLPSNKRSKIYRYLTEIGTNLGDYIFDLYVNPDNEILNLLGVEKHERTDDCSFL